MKSKILIFRVKQEADDMAVAVEARTCLETLIARYPRELPLKAVFPRLARLLRMSVRRIETIWRGTAKLTACEMDRLRAAVLATQEESHADKLERAARTLETIDPDFYGQEIARLRDAVRQLWRVAHPERI